MQLNIVLRTDTDDVLSILFEGSAEDARIWADEILSAYDDYESAHVETQRGRKLCSRPAGGVWGEHLGMSPESGSRLKAAGLRENKILQRLA